MKLGTHNSMSFLPVKKWWMKPLNIFARCQKLDLKGQLGKDAVIFDIRVWWNKKAERFEFAHGLIDYDGDGYPLGKYSVISSALDQLTHTSAQKYIRVILEKYDDYITDTREFHDLCIYLEYTYPKFILFGGIVKKGWKKIFAFDKEYKAPTDRELKQYVGSMASDARWYERFIPMLYAKRRTRFHTIKSLGSEDFILVDFII